MNLAHSVDPSHAQTLGRVKNLVENRIVSYRGDTSHLRASHCNSHPCLDTHRIMFNGEQPYFMKSQVKGSKEQLKHLNINEPQPTK